MASNNNTNTDAKIAAGPQISNGNAGKIIDPTANVLSLVDAAVTRLNDLQDAAVGRINDLHNTEKERVNDVLLEHNKHWTSEIQHIKEVAELRAEYQEKLTLAESKRIDAIRAVDVAAVAVAGERAGAQATVLANQVSTSADALRTLVASTSTTLATQQQAIVQALSERLTALERSQYEGKGRSAYSDPQMEDMVKELRSLREARSEGTGKGQGISSVWTVFLGAVAAISILYAMYTSSVKSVQPVYAPAPTTQTSK